MSMWRRSFKTGNDGWLSLQWALRVLRDTSFAVTVHSRCCRCVGGRTVGACLCVF